MSLVLDSSATLARAYPDECTPVILELFRRIAVTNAWAPPLWKLEIANSLNTNVRRGRLSLEERRGIFRLLENLPIDFDDETEKRVWTDTVALADRHRITVYDATYLELALRLSLPLATLDRELRAAAQAESIPLLGL